MVKYPPLNTEDIAEVNQIKNDVYNWRKQNLKDENEYGAKTKDKEILQNKIDSKLLITKMRQKR